MIKQTCPCCEDNERLKAEVERLQGELAQALGSRVSIALLKHALKSWSPNKAGDILYTLGLLGDDDEG